MTAFTIGPLRALPFWERCFAGQPFFYTRAGSEEHVSLWEEGARDDEEGAGGSDADADADGGRESVSSTGADSREL